MVGRSPGVTCLLLLRVHWRGRVPKQHVQPKALLAFPVAFVALRRDLEVMTMGAALGAVDPQRVHKRPLGGRVESQAVVLVASHEAARLFFVVRQPLCQETRLTVSMSASQTNPAKIFAQHKIPLLIQRLRAKVGTTVQHVKTLLGALSPFALVGNDGRRPVTPSPPTRVSLDLGTTRALRLRGFVRAIWLCSLGS